MQPPLYGPNEISFKINSRNRHLAESATQSLMDQFVTLMRSAIAVQSVERMVWAEVFQILKDNLPPDYPGDLDNIQLPDLVLFYIMRMRELEAALAVARAE